MAAVVPVQVNYQEAFPLGFAISCSVTRPPSYGKHQCCGTGNDISLGRDPVPLVRGMDPDPDPSIIKQKL